MADAIQQLQALVGGENVLASPEDLVCYGYDATWLEGSPGAIVCPTSAKMVSQVMAWADQRRVVVVPRGAGTGLAGGSIPAPESVVLSLSRMNRILEIDPANMVAVVQAGVVTADLQTEVEHRGLFYPPDPSSLRQCTLGGNVATSASGSRGLKYGGTRDYVLGLEVVLASGELIRTGGRVIKNATGYNLTQLFLGSEGTLGVVTEVTLRLLPLPRARGMLMAAFSHLEDAAQAVTAVLLGGVIPAAIELMDQTTVACVEEYLRAGLPTQAGALILVEVDGGGEEVVRDLGRVSQLLEENGAWEVVVADRPQDIDRLRQARASVSASLGRLRPDRLGEDISVPRSAIPAMVRRIQQVSSDYDLIIALFGHIGDGNLHPIILFDRRNLDEVSRVEAAARDICLGAVELGGTLSGEHGVGLLKKDFLTSALEPGVIALMKEIKRAFDPHNILNPGKIFPTDAAR
ncbi:MAG: FAD-binding oxidoreductase [Dehalococcoidia bacterium]